MAIIDAPVQLLPEPGSLIGDRMVTDGSGGEYDHVYAATGRPTKRVPLAGPPRGRTGREGGAGDVFPGWKSMQLNERRRLFLKLAELLRRDAETLGTLTTVDAGVPKGASDASAADGAEFFEYNAGWIDRIGGEVRPTPGPAAHTYTLDEPYGVVCAMTPFNAPIIASCMILAPTLAAGNTMVVKPSEVAPFAIVRLGELFLEAGFPPGVVNFLPGPPQTGEALVRSPGVDKVFFEGSTKSAKYVMVAAAESGLKPIALELGGKSPCIVFDDVDIEYAVQSAVLGGLALGGQGCILGTRLLIQAPIYDEFVEKATKLTSQIKVGDPALNTTMMGPVVNEKACDRILDVIAQAASDGQGKVTTGGERLGGELADGYFVAPTLFADVDNAMPLAREEVFGPVLAIIRFDTEDDALRMANDSQYGLGAYVHSKDAQRVHRLAQALEVGSVYVNGMPPGPSPSTPFGGIKHSGFGRVGGIEGIREFTRPKSVRMMLERSASPYPI